MVSHHYDSMLLCQYAHDQCDSIHMASAKQLQNVIYAYLLPVTDIAQLDIS